MKPKTTSVESMIYPIEKNYITTLFYLRQLNMNYTLLDSARYDGGTLILNSVDDMIFKCALCSKRKTCLTKNILKKQCKFLNHELLLELKMEGLIE